MKVEDIKDLVEKTLKRIEEGSGGLKQKLILNVT